MRRGRPYRALGDCFKLEITYILQGTYTLPRVYLFRCALGAHDGPLQVEDEVRESSPEAEEKANADAWQIK